MSLSTFVYKCQFHVHCQYHRVPYKEMKKKVHIIDSVVLTTIVQVLIPNSTFSSKCKKKCIPVYIF